MIINLNQTKFYFLTHENKIRKEHIKKEFEEFNPIEVNPLKIKSKFQSGASGFLKILDKATMDQKNNIFKPFVILEDDVKKYREIPKEINIPDNTDILYIGLSNWGLTNKECDDPRCIIRPEQCKSEYGCVLFKNINSELGRIYNMLSTHGMLICSLKGMLLFQKCLLEDFFKDRPYDLSICKMQPHINVYALKEPLVYQYGKIGGHEFATKINFLNKKDNVISENGISTNSISFLTNI